MHACLCVLITPQQQLSCQITYVLSCIAGAIEWRKDVDEKLFLAQSDDWDIDD